MRDVPLRDHLPLVVLLLAGAVLRGLAIWAIRPGIWFSDSNGYIRGAATGELNPVRVDGYAFFVTPFWLAGSATALIVVQHLIGLAHRRRPLRTARAARRPAVARDPRGRARRAGRLPDRARARGHGRDRLPRGDRRRARRCCCGTTEPGVAAALAAGLLLGYAAIARSVGLPLTVVVLAYLLARRVGWRPLAAFAGGAAVVRGRRTRSPSTRSTASTASPSPAGASSTRASRRSPTARASRSRRGSGALCPDPARAAADERLPAGARARRSRTCRCAARAPASSPGGSSASSRSTTSA